MSFNRETVYPNEQLQSSVFLQMQQDASKSLFQFILDAMGSTNAVFTGLAATPGTGLTVSIADGALYQFSELDPTAWSTLSADTSLWYLQGLLRTATTLSGFAAPTTSGDSINYLVEAELVVTDSATVSMPFTNGATPPVTVYELKSPTRTNVINFQVVAGTAAATGSQTTPAATSGWVPLWQVTVAYGETQIITGNIALAPSAPQFAGFVHQNPNGATPVFLSPGSAQTGFIDITGNVTAGSFTGTTSLFGGASATTNYDGTWHNGFAGDYLSLTAVGFTGSSQTTDSMDIKGSIGYTGTHAGTDGDPYPVSQLNVAMFGGKLPADYALAGGNYITLYSGAPTLGVGNAGVTGYLEANTFASTVASGTPPFTVTSTTEVANLNANYLGGFLPGNPSGFIPLNNGTLNVNLNAQYLNGLASSAFQPAGNYAQMNVTNTGSFTASSSISTSGGLSGTQLSMAYISTNGYGMNSGGSLAYVLADVAPLGLLGSKVLTQGPLYVGGDAANQDVYAQDIIPGGLLRAGFAAYRVTRMNGYSDAPTPTAPGYGTDYGVFPSLGGGISLPMLLNGSGSAETISFRMIITLSSAMYVVLNIRANDAVSVFLDNAQEFSANNNTGAYQCVASFTIPIGTHTIDIVGSFDGQGNDDHLLVFPWFPFSGNQITPVITSAVHG